MLISEIYRKHPITFSDKSTIYEALLELMKDEVNALVILNESEKVVGVLSLQDIAAATVPRQFRKNIRMAAAMYKEGFFTEMCQRLKDEPVSKIMRKDFVSVNLHDNIMAVTADFLNNDLYIVPVVEKKKLVGVVTRTEIKKALLYGMRNIEKEEK
jgi:predicted transcriptional regulator